jgi:RHS repeat-associated protein
MTGKCIVIRLVLAVFIGGWAIQGQADERVISPSLGFQPAHSYAVSDIESIDKATGSLALHIPLAQLPAGAAGFTAGLTLVYNNKYWEVEPIADLYPLRKSFSGGWRLSMTPSLDVEYLASKGESDPCGYYLTSELFQMKLTNPDGSRNIFLVSKPAQQMPASCGAGIYLMSKFKNLNTPSIWYTTDGSFLRLEIDAPSVTGLWPYNSSWTLYRQDGSSIRYEVVSKLIYLRDRNGNKVSVTKTVDPQDRSHTYEVMSDEFGRTIRLDHFGDDRDEVSQAGHSGTPMIWRVYYGYPGAVIPDVYVCSKSQLGCYFDDPPRVAMRLELPNGLSYVFGYDRPQPFASNYRELRTMTLPTGAKIDYGYRLDDKSVPADYFHVLANPLTSKTIFINGAIIQKWEMSYDVGALTGSYGRNTHKAPDGGLTIHEFNVVSYKQGLTPFSGIITKILYPDGSMVDRDWQNNYPSEKTPNLHWSNPWVRREWTTNANASGNPVATSVKVFTIDKNGNTTTVEERGWLSYSASLPDPSSAPLIRKTVHRYLNGANDSTDLTNIDTKAYSYASLGSPSTPRNLRASTETQNGSGVVKSRSQFEYTEVNPVRTAGNLTAEYHWDSTRPGYSSIGSGTVLTASNAIVKRYEYTPRGNLKKETDARGIAATYDYGYIEGCPPNSSTGSDLYRTGTHQGQNGSAALLDWSYGYNCNSGKPTSTLNPNSFRTTIVYDNYGRPITIMDGRYRQTVHTYNDASLWIVTQTDVNSYGDLRNTSVHHYDPLGRIRLSRQLETAVHNPNDAAANESIGIKTDTKYVFSLNRNEIWTSNPYRESDANAPTRGWTVTRFDKTGRECVEEGFAGAGAPAIAENCTSSAGSTGAVTHKYDASLNWTSSETIDAAGKARKLYQDVLGRLVVVREDPAAARYDTYYQYDLLDNLVGTRQAGSCGSTDPVATPCGGGQTRTFVYDSLKRLSAATNPEMAGNVLSYEYDGNGNVTGKLSSGAPALLVSYTYDSLNRVKTRDYSDGTTPPVTYCYDGRTWNGSFDGCDGLPSTGSKGLLTDVGSSVSRTSYAYNLAGKVSKSIQTTAGRSFTFGYSYTGALALSTLTYPSGRKVTTQYDDAGRPKNLLGQYMDVKKDYAGSAGNMIRYASHGDMSSMTMGNGIVENWNYNSRLQPTKIQAGGLLSIWNCFQTSDDASCPSLATVSANNGNVQGQRITRGAQDWTQKFTYDGVNRLSSASETNNWQQNYGYDQYGNRWISSSNGLPVSALTPTSQSAFSDATNRLAGMNNYDPRGNLKSYGSYALTYDGEGRISSASGVAPSTKYEYDGEGRRVRAYVCSSLSTCSPGSGASTTVYVYDAFGKLAAEYSPNTGQSGTSYFTLDHLGSVRLETNASGQQISCSDYLPFGEEISAGYGSRPFCFAPSNTRQRFTSKERDIETGLDFFLARYYSGAQGRFLSPDEWKGGPEDALTGKDITPPGPLPYADIFNPQSLNKYAYVYNNPLNLTDPDGHCPLCITAGVGALTGSAVSLISQKWAHPDKPVNWKSVAAAAVGGAVTGATFGLMTAPAAITTISGTTFLQAGVSAEIGAGTISGVIGGVAKREAEAVIAGGDPNKAIGTLGQIAGDAIGGGLAAGVNTEIVKPMVKELSYVGRAVSIGEQKIAKGVRPSPNLPARQAQLKKLQTTASAVGSTAVKTVVKREEERYK